MAPIQSATPSLFLSGPGPKNGWTFATGHSKVPSRGSPPETSLPMQALPARMARMRSRTSSGLNEPSS